MRVMSLTQSVWFFINHSWMDGIFRTIVYRSNDYTWMMMVMIWEYIDCTITHIPPHWAASQACACASMSMCWCWRWCWCWCVYVCVWTLYANFDVEISLMSTIPNLYIFLLELLNLLPIPFTLKQCANCEYFHSIRCCTEYIAYLYIVWAHVRSRYRPSLRCCVAYNQKFWSAAMWMGISTHISDNRNVRNTQAHTRTRTRIHIHMRVHTDDGILKYIYRIQELDRRMKKETHGKWQWTNCDMCNVCIHTFDNSVNATFVAAFLFTAHTPHTHTPIEWNWKFVVVVWLIANQNKWKCDNFF